MHKKLGTKSFTLIELIIVISIISLLSLIGLSGYGAVRENARNAKRKADLKEMQKALEAYKARNGSYPLTDTAATTSGHKWFAHCNFAANNPAVVVEKEDNTMIPGLAPEFIPNLPHDPREDKANPDRSKGCSGGQCGSCATADRNCYKYMSNGSDYKLVAHCGPEGTLSKDDPFFDPQRYQATTDVMWAWQVSSSSNTNNW